MAYKLTSAINIALKLQWRNEGLTAEQVIYDIENGSERINSMIDKDNAKRFLSDIRTSPEYWFKKKKEVFAMIRQFGVPTFFVTLSPAELEWPELLTVLMKTVYGKDITHENAENLTKNEKIDLMSKDPITCSRYFHNRMSSISAYILNKINGPFSAHPITDWYWRIEFQNRGSPHAHFIFWCVNKPSYDRITPNCAANEQCIMMVDKYITCEEPENPIKVEALEENEGLPASVKVNIKIQRHKHHNELNKGSAKCLIKEKTDVHYDEDCSEFLKCQYGFPKPILEETIILEPFKTEFRNTEEFKQLKKQYRRIHKALDELSKHNETFFKINKFPIEIKLGTFLEALNIDYKTYLDCIKTSILRTTVFLRRRSMEIMTNNYNKDIIMRHRGNMDIQFITDPYGVIVYLTSYMMKANHKMSKILDMAAQEVEKGHKTLQQKLHHIASKFQNCSEISVQECVYFLLGIPVSNSSRDCIFIMTQPENERYLTVKSLEELKSLPPKSKNIFKRSSNDFYATRPQRFNDTCLAVYLSHYEFMSEAAYDKKFFSEDQTEAMKTNSYSELSDVDEDDDYFEIFKNVGDVFETDEEVRAGYIKIPNGYLRVRQFPKVIRYVRYNKKKDRINFYREQLMLFLPWRDLQTELENGAINHFEIFERNKHTIAANKAIFESLFGDTCADEFLQEMDEEIRSYYEELFHEDADTMYKVDDLLMQNFNLCEDIEEETEEETLQTFGNHVPLTDPKRNLITSGLENQNSKKAAKRLSTDSYKRMMISLNEEQRKYVMNSLHLIKNNEIFHHFVTGCAGTGKYLNYSYKLLNLCFRLPRFFITK